MVFITRKLIISLMKKVLVLIFILLNGYFSYSQMFEDEPERYSYNRFDFKNEDFKKSVSFNLEQFKKRTFFTNAHFRSKADFEYLYFHSKVFFGGTQFHSKSRFIGTHFYSKASFTMAQFYSNAGFNGSEFHSKSHFNGTIFFSDVDFQYVKFHSRIEFCGAHFKSNANFSYLFVKNGDEIDFRNTILPDTLFFNKVEIERGVIDFTRSKIDQSRTVCNINLIGTDISKINFRYKRFNLCFPPETDVDIKEGAYERLLNRTKELGYSGSYEKLDKEYQEFQYLSENNLWYSLINLIEKYWWGYGYDNWRIFVNTIILFVVFVAFNAFNFTKMIMKVYVLDDYKRSYLEHAFGKRKFRRVIKAFSFSILYTSLIFFGLKFSLDKLRYSELMKSGLISRLLLFYFFFMYTVGLVCLGFIANVIIAN